MSNSHKHHSAIRRREKDANPCAARLNWILRLTALCHCTFCSARNCTCASIKLWERILRTVDGIEKLLDAAYKTNYPFHVVIYESLQVSKEILQGCRVSSHRIDEVHFGAKLLLFGSWTKWQS